MGEVRRYFEAYEAVDTIGLLIDRAEDVASVPDIRRYQLFVDAGRRVPLCVRAHDALIARRARCDCLLEESRIRGDAAEAFFANARRARSPFRIIGRVRSSIQQLWPFANSSTVRFICTISLSNFVRTTVGYRHSTLISGAIGCSRGDIFSCRKMSALRAVSYSVSISTADARSGSVRAPTRMIRRLRS
jgi:hypothetical protein